jgi:hypothetical protein
MSIIPFWVNVDNTKSKLKLLLSNIINQDSYLGRRISNEKVFDNY